MFVEVEAYQSNRISVSSPSSRIKNRFLNVREHKIPTRFKLCINYPESFKLSRFIYGKLFGVVLVVGFERPHYNQGIY